MSGPEGAHWTPIYKAEKGHIVFTSLPSGNIEDTTGAVMAKIKTVCTFACSPDGIDIVQMGKAHITAHHHIQTAEGWMTARQAAQQGRGKLVNKVHIDKVYNLCLERGGNVIIDTTARPQEAPTMTATMDCLFELTKGSQHTGSLTYPPESLQQLGLHLGMSTGRRHFHTCDVSILPNGEIILNPPIPGDDRFKTPIRARMRNIITPQSQASRSKIGAQLEAAANSEMTQEDEMGEPRTNPKKSLGHVTILEVPHP